MSIFKNVLLATGFIVLSAPVLAQSQVASNSGHWTDARTTVVKTGSNLCLRAGSWSAASGAACDSTVAAAPAAAAPAPAAAAAPAAPVAAAAPAAAAVAAPAPAAEPAPAAKPAGQ